MEWSRIKTIVIIMLFLVNIVMAAFVLYRGNAAETLRDDAKENIVDIFKRNGISIEKSAIPDDGVIYELKTERNLESEAKIAELFLGTTVREDQGGNIFYYQSSDGWAKFRGNGDFEIELGGGGIISDGDYKELVYALLKQMDFTADSKTTEISTDGITVFRVYQNTNGNRIFNCLAEFEFENGRLVKVSGKRLTGVLLSGGGEGSMNAMTALMSFLNNLNEGGEVCSEVRAVEIGYYAELPASGVLSLIPTWKITADTGEYHINALTGEMERI